MPFKCLDRWYITQEPFQKLLPKKPSPGKPWNVLAEKAAKRTARGGRYLHVLWEMSASVRAQGQEEQAECFLNFDVSIM